MKKQLTLLLALTLISCFNSSNENEEYEYDSSDDSYNSKSSRFSSSYADEEVEEEEFDGTYEAEIDYYNPETGTRSTYTLEVEVENGELTVIQWPNGGWLDSSHFYPPDITSGHASFESDEGHEYEVRLLEKID
jgi:hypothetical protein